jgi:hypothetical protein
MPHRVDTGVKAMKPPEAQTPIDRILTQPKPTELSTTHDPILLLRQFSDPGISEASLR